MPYLKVYLLLFLLLFSSHQTDAAFFIKIKPAQTPAEQPAPKWSIASQRTHSTTTFLRQPQRMDDEAPPKKNNRRGVASLLCMGLLFTVFTAVVIITPTIPGGLTLMLCLLGLGSSVAAIVLGKRGVKYDRHRGYAIAGMILGYGVLSLMVFTLLILSMIGGGLGAVFL